MPPLPLDGLPFIDPPPMVPPDGGFPDGALPDGLPGTAAEDEDEVAAGLAVVLDVAADPHADIVITVAAARPTAVADRATLDLRACFIGHLT